MTKQISSHHERAHSKFSASGAERWFACPGSVALSEGLPDVDSPAAKEGTKAHEVLESLLTVAMKEQVRRIGHAKFPSSIPHEMVYHGTRAANFILSEHARASAHAELMVETRVYLDFIHPEMFGTFDGAIIDHFGVLHVFDYKYGKYAVSPTENLQMIFYGIGMASLFHWNFKKARLWIIQPRSKNYEGPVMWDLSISELKNYVGEFERAVERVEKYPERYVEGEWCFFCKAKGKCPLKQQGRVTKAMGVFSANPITKG